MKVTERLMINCAHSPDSDDAFMYYGIASGAVSTGNFVFKQVMKDIQTLNEEAKEGKYEITAISFAAYPQIKDRYLLMPCGASFGQQYGPMVVCRENEPLPMLNAINVAIPGYMTTAYLLLRLYCPEVKVIALPFEEIIPAVQNRVVEAGLIIHEGQLTHEQFGLKKLIDLGRWWDEKTNLPLPLGGNAIRRDLGQDKILQLTEILKNSVVYALNNRKTAMNYAFDFARGMSEKIVDKYINMYVNDLSIDCGDRGRLAVKKLFQLAREAGLLEEQFNTEFVS
jgi:1,4-dihydroxy-6-naphthoate synthase